MSTKSGHRFAMNYLMSQPWMLDQQLLATMSNIANREASTLTLDDIAPDALAAKAGKPATRGMEIREGGVALIHVSGVISRYANLFTNICGGTTTQLLAQDFNKALHDPAVKTIIFDMDSPGGEAKGIHELSEMIFNARGKKRLIAYVGGEACSAAYWIASACDEVVIDATASVGSIGTVLEMRVRKQRDDDEYETVEIVSSQSPNKRKDPTTKPGRELYQNHLDDLAEVFVQRVARNMSVNRDTVINEFGGGDFVIGQKAVEKGMAHRLGSLESIISEAKRKKHTMTQTHANTGDSNASLALPSADVMSATELASSITAQRPDVIAAIKTEDEPEQAVAFAAEIASSCAKAGVPELSASLLKPGVTKAAADEQIKTASRLKDTLSASGLSGSYQALVSSIDDPVAMVGKAIHEAKAEADESSDNSRQINDQTEKTAAINAREIYQNR